MSVGFMLLCQLWVGGAWALPAEPAGSLAPGRLEADRKDYSEATEAIRRGGWKDFEQLRSSLDNYPLAIYLDYYKLSAQPARVRPGEARRFIDLSQDTPLPNRFLALYLDRAGRDRRWQDFLQVMPAEPKDVVLKCYYFRAKLAARDQLAAWEGAERLWVYGKSRPRECDPLFEAWLKAGELSDDIVWARLLEAFAAGQKSLLTYVARKGSDKLRPWSDKLLAVYARPERLAGMQLSGSSGHGGDVASYGVARLARFSPEQALATWQKLEGVMNYTPEQVHRAEYAIALRGLFAKSEALIPWLDTHLGNDKLVETRLRWALLEQDWNALERTLALLSPGRAQETEWRYWGAVAKEKNGQLEAARRALRAIASQRDFYGFLAADKLGEPYAFNNVAATALGPPLAGAAPSIGQLPAVGRIEELVYHDERQAALSEWNKVLGDADDARRVDLASYAAGRGWYRMAIDGANRAGAWDRLDLRFPVPYRETFEHYASLQNVPSTELMAIARRESAFFPAARSPVGARGLMQLMPATGKQMARSLGTSHAKADLYQVDYNVLLGSAYYRQLLDRYRGNRVLALAAYNAGPNRVDRWQNKAHQSVPVDIWIATIPYPETRNYVQAVLSYNVVFHHLLGSDHSLLTADELSATY